MNGNLDWRMVDDDADNAQFARGARWAVGIVTTLIAASVASAIFTLASAL